MPNKKKQTPSWGITVLSYIYLFLSVLATISLFVIPYKVIAVQSFGVILPSNISVLTRAALFIVPLYLFFGFKSLKISAWTAAIYYHCFFIINSVLSLAPIIFKSFPIKAPLQIIAKPEFNFPMEDIGSALIKKIIIHSISLAFGIIAIHYLNKKKEEFK